jgi:hypothetical protein
MREIIHVTETDVKGIDLDVDFLFPALLFGNY